MIGSTAALGTAIVFCCALQPAYGDAAFDSLSNSSESAERALYWVGFVGMALGCAIFFGRWAWNGYRDFYVYWSFAVLVGAMAYWGLAFLHGQVDMNGFHLNWIRYLDWVFSTPMIVVSIAGLGRFTSQQKMALVFADVTMIAVGFFAAISPEPGRWGFFAFGCGMFLVIAASLWRGAGRTLRLVPRGGPQMAYRALLGLTLVSWTVYPVIFGIGPEGAGRLNRAGEAAAHTVLDLMAKVVCGCLYLYAAERRFKRGGYPEDVQQRPSNREGRLGQESPSFTGKKKSSERTSVDDSVKKRSGLLGWWRSRPGARDSNGEERLPAAPNAPPVAATSGSAVGRSSGPPVGPDGVMLQVGQHVYFRGESGESEIGRIVSFSDDARKLRIRRFLRARRMARVQLSAAALAITREARQFDRLLVRSNQLVLVDTAHVLGRCSVQNSADVPDLAAYLQRDPHAWFYVDSYDILSGRTARGDAPNASSHEDSTSDDDVTFQAEFEGAPVGGGTPLADRPPLSAGAAPRGDAHRQAGQWQSEPNAGMYAEDMTPRRDLPPRAAATSPRPDAARGPWGAPVSAGRISRQTGGGDERGPWPPSVDEVQSQWRNTGWNPYDGPASGRDSRGAIAGDRESREGALQGRDGGVGRDSRTGIGGAASPAQLRAEATRSPPVGGQLRTSPQLEGEAVTFGRGAGTRTPIMREEARSPQLLVGDGVGAVSGRGPWGQPARPLYQGSSGSGTVVGINSNADRQADPRDEREGSRFVQVAL